jgi:hypothetical protein
MNQFIIHLPPDSYASNDFGEFCVQLGDYYFPSKGWTDFGERVVFSWANQLIELLTGKSKKVYCRFMDGNYRLDAETTGSKEILNVAFIRDASNVVDVKHQENVNSEQFIQEILRVMTAFQEECKKNGNYEAVDRIQVSIEKFAQAKNFFSQKIPE